MPTVTITKNASTAPTSFEPSVRPSFSPSTYYWVRPLSTSSHWRVADVLAGFMYLTVKQDRNPDGTLPSRLTSFFRVSSTHGEPDAIKRGGAYTRSVSPVLRILIAAWPPLIVRGVFGLLQALIPAINYTMPNVYRTDVFQFKSYFIACEMVFAVLMEWSACCLLCCTMLTDEGNKKIRAAHKAKMRGQQEAEDGDTPMSEDQRTMRAESHEFAPINK
jgi:hypothetical protein